MYDNLDPALAEPGAPWQVLHATCLRLVNHGAPTGGRLVPEAAPWPRIARDGRTYIFDVRPVFTRFSNGERVGPSSFARSIRRLLSPNVHSTADELVADIAGVGVRGSRLSIRLRRPAYDFLARLAMPYFCSLSRGHPERPRYPEGRIEAAGPYYVATADGGRPIVLRRNPYYRGPRARVAASIEVFNSSGRMALARVESGAVDLAADVELQPGERPTTARLLDTAAPGVLAMLFGTGPGKPFDNPRLRKAAALAVDRVAIAGRRGFATDALAPRTVPGLRRRSIYPLRPTADSLSRARDLAQGLVPVRVTMRGGAYPREREFAESLGTVGIHAGRKRTLDCDYDADLYLLMLPTDYADLSSALRFLADDRLKRTGCYWPARFDTGWKPRLHRALALRGLARLRELAAIETSLVRDRTTVVGLFRPVRKWLVSARIGCFRPHRVYQVDLGSLCLR